MKKIKWYPRVFISFFLILVILGALSVKGNQFLQRQGNFQKIDFKTCFVEAKGYQISNEYEFDITRDDPAVIISLEKIKNGNTKAIKLRFEEKISLSDVRIYYGRENSEFTENDSETPGTNQSSEILLWNVENVKFLRIDIDQDFKLRDIEAADEVNLVKSDVRTEYILMIGINLLVSFFLAFIKRIDDIFDQCRGKIIYILKKSWKRRKRIFIHLTALLTMMLISFLTEILLMEITDSEYMNYNRGLVIFAAFFSVYLAVVFRKTAMKQAHIYFFLLSLVVGTIHIIIAPPAPGISYDDEIHYGKAAYLSRGADGLLSHPDCVAIGRYADVIYKKDIYHYEERKKWENEINELYEKNNILEEEDRFASGVEFIAYVPAALGLNLGRGIGLSFIHTFMLGKWMNLLCYSSFISLAVRLFRGRGKMIATMIGLIPTSLFMASSYNYDWWVISFVILGYSLFLSAWQKEKNGIPTKRFLLSVLCVAIGIMPKAVYFPLLIPMMILRSKNYQNSKICRMSVVIVIIMLVATFMLPMIFEGEQMGDLRGGQDVNAAEQVHYVLANPVKYAQVLMKFLAEYLSLEASKSYLTAMAYYGSAKHYIVCILVLAMTVILDNRGAVKAHKIGNVIRLGTIAFLFTAIVLIVTALYISYTPVGADYVQGCQHRYILPVLFTFLYYVGNADICIPNNIKKNVLVLQGCIMSFIFLEGIYTLCVQMY